MESLTFNLIGNTGRENWEISSAKKMIKDNDDQITIDVISDIIEDDSELREIFLRENIKS